MSWLLFLALDWLRLKYFHFYLLHFSGYLNLGYSTPFLSLGASYMYPSLASAKAAVISVGEEIASQGLPSGICPLVFVFTGSGNGNLSILTQSPLPSNIYITINWFLLRSILTNPQSSIFFLV